MNKNFHKCHKSICSLSNLSGKKLIHQKLALNFLIWTIDKLTYSKKLSILTKNKKQGFDFFFTVTGYSQILYKNTKFFTSTKQKDGISIVLLSKKDGIYVFHKLKNI